MLGRSEVLSLGGWKKPNTLTYLSAMSLRQPSKVLEKQKQHFLRLPRIGGLAQEPAWVPRAAKVQNNG